MIKIPYDELLGIIVEKSSLPKFEVEQKIDDKLKQLSGLISKEGAAHIVANELKVKVIEQPLSRKADIKNLAQGMRNVEIVGKVNAVFDVREFQVAKRSGKVGSFFVQDGTGSIRVVAWGKMTDHLVKLKKDDIVKVESGLIKLNNDNLEMHLNEDSKLIINPKGVEVTTVDTTKPERMKISEITKNPNTISRAEVMGVLVQLFEPKFFEVCPQCGKRIRDVEGTFKCVTHGVVEPKFSYLITTTIDDGTGSLRVVCFRDSALELLSINKEKFLKLKDKPEEFETYKDKIIGKQYVLKGRIRKNSMFDRTELFPDSIVEPNVEDEKKLLEQ